MGLADPVFEVKLTPNRPDCTGVRGIARDLAAAGLGTLKPEKAISGVEGADPARRRSSSSSPRKRAAPVRCSPARCIKGVTNGPSPAWLQTRLKAVGLRPINALVDVTNYISQDRGRPLHVYDADKLKGAVRARLGKAGEKFLGLDGKEHAVDDTMCVIADDNGPLGLGGIIGGEASGSTEATTERADRERLFDPARTAATGRKTGLVTDARYRFERGVDPAFRAPGPRSGDADDPQDLRRQAVEGDGRRQGAGRAPRHHLRHRARRQAGWARAAGQRDQSDPGKARLRCPRQGRRHHRNDAVVASGLAWRRRSRRGGRAHRRPRSRAGDAAAAPRWRRARRADRAPEARPPRPPHARRPRPRRGDHLVVHSRRRSRAPSAAAPGSSWRTRSRSTCRRCGPACFRGC